MLHHVAPAHHHIIMFVKCLHNHNIIVFILILIMLILLIYQLGFHIFVSRPFVLTFDILSLFMILF